LGWYQQDIVPPIVFWMAQLPGAIHVYPQASLQPLEVDVVSLMPYQLVPLLRHLHYQVS